MVYKKMRNGFKAPEHRTRPFTYHSLVIDVIEVLSDSPIWRLALNIMMEAPIRFGLYTTGPQEGSIE